MLYAKLVFRLNTERRMAICRKLASLLRNDFTLMDALGRLEMIESKNGKKPNEPFAIVMRQWQKNLERGMSFSDATRGWVPPNETLLEQPVNKIVAVGTGTNVGEESDMPLIGDGVIVLQTGEVLTYTSSKTFKATAYTHTDAGCDRITATGTRVRVGTVAVDPRVIPYGTRMFIVTNDGSYIYGIATAEDCGGAIKENRIDLYFETTSECFKFGRRTCTVYFLGDAQGIFW